MRTLASARYGVFRCRMITCAIVANVAVFAAPADANVVRWMTTQEWVRDLDKPILALGNVPAWDDTHIFAPCVARENGTYSMWYCGSSGAVSERVFRLGLATSADGVHFERHPSSPVFEFGDGLRSVLTPTLLRNPDGSVCREDGALRMWFSSTDFSDPDALHTLHETRSRDSVHWAVPSPTQLEHAYAPTVVKENGVYRMWYCDVSRDPWVVRHARSEDGARWVVADHPCLEIDQAWEQGRLFYPTVVKDGDVYVMWYGAYWAGHAQKTALGLAVSTDGLVWHKNPHNPVFRPDATRPWESHYTTSQSLLRLEDGSWRIWYATRKAPPHINKYFAIGTAHWPGPDSATNTPWSERAQMLRGRVAEILNLPTDKVDLAARTHRTQRGDGYRIESVTYASEPASRVTALLYLPEPREHAAPAVVLACGHGGSKSCLYAQYTGQLYAKLGFACLAVDTIGEEERHAEGGMGTRAHDLYQFKPEERVAFMRAKLKRSILGKIAWDLIRGVDYLQTRPEVAPDRIGVLGYSLGGASAGCLAVLDERIRATVICGWGFIPTLATYGKECTRLPYEAFSAIMGFDEMTALLAPHCATLFLSGDSDSIIDPEEGGAALVRQVRDGVASAARILDQAGMKGAIECRFVRRADHRPLFLTHEAVAWMLRHLVHQKERVPVPQQTVKFGDWVDAQGQQIEKLYNTETRERGNLVIDIGAVYYDPKDLACFPEQEAPAAEYTFQGWVNSLVGTD